MRLWNNIFNRLATSLPREGNNSAEHEAERTSEELILNSHNYRSCDNLNDRITNELDGPRKKRCGVQAPQSAAKYGR